VQRLAANVTSAASASATATETAPAMGTALAASGSGSGSATTPSSTTKPNFGLRRFGTRDERGVVVGVVGVVVMGAVFGMGGV
jgi:hypothetical protein